MSKQQSALAKVQDLYLIQVELWRFLDAPIAQVTPDAVCEAKKHLRAFSDLLTHADWQYMGGEDVVETLRAMRAEVDAKIKRTTAHSTRRVISAQPRFKNGAKLVAAAAKKALTKAKKAVPKKAVKKKSVKKAPKAKTKKSVAKKRKK